MDGFREYPENRLDIRMDGNGNVSYEENREFAKYYAPTREELEEELEELESELDILNLDEPVNILSFDHDEWEDQVNRLEERIRDIEDALDNME